MRRDAFLSLAIYTTTVCPMRYFSTFNAQTDNEPERGRRSQKVAGLGSAAASPFRLFIHYFQSGF